MQEVREASQQVRIRQLGTSDGKAHLEPAYGQAYDSHANNFIEVGEEDTRCTRKRGPCPRAQAPDLRTQHHHPVEYKGKLMEVKVEA